MWDGEEKTFEFEKSILKTPITNSWVGKSINLPYALF
jgi:hypothetical protein